VSSKYFIVEVVLIVSVELPRCPEALPPRDDHLAMHPEIPRSVSHLLVA
jgi:hypothetical protein